MAEKRRKTEIIVGLAPHFISSPAEMRKYIENADVIFAEAPPHVIEQLTSGRNTPRGIAIQYEKPTFMERYLTVLKEAHDRGKRVIGTDFFPSSEQKLEELSERQWHRLAMDDQIGFAEILATEIKLREQERLAWIRKHLPEFEGKRIYIDAGEEHTKLYHELKRLDPEKFDVKREHLAKGEFEKGVLTTYPPQITLARVFHFDTKTSKDYTKLRKLEQNTEQFKNEMRDRLGWKTRDEAGIEKETFGLLRKIAFRRKK